MSTVSNVKFFVTGDTNAPQKQKNDCGIDIFIPNLTEQFINDLSVDNPGHPIKWGVVGAPEPESDNPDKPRDPNAGLFLYVPPHEDLLITTYIKARFSADICLKVENRSGVSTRQKLFVGASIIDPSYEGIIKIHVINFSNTMKFLTFGQKIAQLVPYKFDTQEHEVFYDESIEKFKILKNTTTLETFYLNHETHRGEGGFGSTDKSAVPTANQIKSSIKPD